MSILENKGVKDALDALPGAHRERILRGAATAENPDGFFAVALRNAATDARLHAEYVVRRTREILRREAEGDLEECLRQEALQVTTAAYDAAVDAVAQRQLATFIALRFMGAKVNQIVETRGVSRDVVYQWKRRAAVALAATATPEVAAWLLRGTRTRPPQARYQVRVTTTP